MKKTLVLLSLISILSSCDNQGEELIEQLTDVELKTDDSLSVTNTNSAISTTASARGEFHLLGYGYDVTGEFADSSAARNKIIDIAKLKADYPTFVIIGKSSTGSSQIFSSDNCEDYLKLVSSKVEATQGSKLFRKSITSFFPLQDALSSKYIYGGYTFIAARRNLKFMPDPHLVLNYLTDDFKLDINSSTPQSIVKKYGTHILSNIALGSKLTVLYQAETANSNREEAASLGLTVALSKVFGLFSGDLDNSTKTSAIGNFSQKIAYKTSGGNPETLYQTSSLGIKHPTVNISNWLKSCSEENMELVNISSSYGALLPIYDIIEDPIKKAEVKKYIESYLAENQVSL